MMYTTRDRLGQDAREYAKHMLELDKELSAEILRKQMEIQKSNSSQTAKEYCLDLLRRVSDKHKQISKAHHVQAAAISISGILMRYADDIEKINKKYGDAMDAFESQLNIGRIVDISNKEIEKIKALASSVEQLTEELPSFDDIYVKLVSA